MLHTISALIVNKFAKSGARRASFYRLHALALNAGDPGRHAHAHTQTTKSRHIHTFNSNSLASSVMKCTLTLMTLVPHCKRGISTIARRPLAIVLWLITLYGTGWAASRAHAVRSVHGTIARRKCDINYTNQSARKRPNPARPVGCWAAGMQKTHFGRATCAHFADLNSTKLYYSKSRNCVRGTFAECGRVGRNPRAGELCVQLFTLTLTPIMRRQLPSPPCQ